MARQSERLEREAEEARAELAYSLEQLRERMTPGQMVDEAVEYARQTLVAEFARNLGRDIRESPLPVLMIFAGVAWAVVASAISQRRPAAPKVVVTPTAAVEAQPDEATVREPVRQDWEVAPLNEAVE